MRGGERGSHRLDLRALADHAVQWHEHGDGDAGRGLVLRQARHRLAEPARPGVGRELGREMDDRRGGAVRPHEGRRGSTRNWRGLHVGPPGATGAARRRRSLGHRISAAMGWAWRHNGVTGRNLFGGHGGARARGCRNDVHGRRVEAGHDAHSNAKRSPTTRLPRSSRHAAPQQKAREESLWFQTDPLPHTTLRLTAPPRSAGCARNPRRPRCPDGRPPCAPAAGPGVRRPARAADTLENGTSAVTRPGHNQRRPSHCHTVIPSCRRAV